MSFCLTFLTGINFFIYPPPCISSSCNANEPASAPVPIEEEKSETSTSVSVIEEFLHHSHDLELSWFEKISIQKIHDAAKLQIVHDELLSPPPELS